MFWFKVLRLGSCSRWMYIPTRSDYKAEFHHGASREQEGSPFPFSSGRANRNPNHEFVWQSLHFPGTAQYAIVIWLEGRFWCGVDITWKKKSTLNIHWQDWCWRWSSNTLATESEEPTHWKRPWCWESLKAGEGDDRGWDGWMVSLTQWTWVWANCRR